MSDVKQKLAAVKCDAAPHGWSDRTTGGILISSFGEYGEHDWRGNTTEDGVDCSRCWTKSDGRNWYSRELDLVPLPAPIEPERLTDAHLNHIERCGTESEQALARELAAARKAIAGQAWTIENFQRQTGDLVAKCAEQSAKLENAADTIQRQAKRWAEISAERDAAIELAREMRDSLIGPGATPQCVKLVREFDERYGQPDSPPCDPPPTCEPLPPVADEPTIEFVRYRYDPAVVYRPKTIDRNTAGRVVKVDCGAVVLTGEFEGLVDGQWRSI